jgi:hypothetical protein
MNIYPNTQCAAYCAWILANSNIRVTTARKIQIQTVQTAANTGGYVTQLYYEEFIAYTSQWYLQFQQYYAQQPIPIPTSLDTLTTAWLAALGTVPTQQTIYSVDAFFKQLRADGNLAIDILYLMCQDNQANGRVSLFNPTLYTLTEIGTPTWTANQGYTGNGSSMYLKTNFIDSTNGVNVTQNSNFIGVYTRLAVGASGAIDAGASNGTNLNSIGSHYTSIGTIAYKENATPCEASSNNTQRLFIAQRTTSTNVTIWENGASLGNFASTAAALVTVQGYIMAENANGTTADYSTNQYALYIKGSGALNMITLNSAVNLLMTNLGAHY